MEPIRFRLFSAGLLLGTLTVAVPAFGAPGDENWDTSFGIPGADGPIWAMTMWGNDLYVAGEFSRIGGVSANKIARWDGTNWTALGSGVLGNYVRALCVHQGQLCVGGLFTNAGGVLASNVVRWNGRQWSPLSEGVNSTVFGLFADWRFSEHFHFTSALLPIATRGAQKLTPIPTGDPEIDSQTADGTLHRTLSYVEIPLLLKWAPKRDVGFRIGAGPSLGIVTGAKDRYEATTASGNPYVLENDIEGQMPGLDFGLSADIDWRFPMLSIAARYTEGLTDLRQPGATTAVHTRVLTGTGRIYLGKKRDP